MTRIYHLLKTIKIHSMTIEALRFKKDQHFTVVYMGLLAVEYMLCKYNVLYIWEYNIFRVFCQY